MSEVNEVVVRDASTNEDHAVRREGLGYVIAEGSVLDVVELRAIKLDTARVYGALN